MTDTYLSVSTMSRCRFRIANSADSPQLFTGAATSATATLRDELLASTRQQELVLRFLAELDRKLDAVLTILQTETLAQEFPHEGHVVELNGTSLRFECNMALKEGAYLEILLMLEEFPLRIVSILGKIATMEEASALPCMHSTAYVFDFLSLAEDDREAIIRYMFSEERKRIRQQKGSC
ncbi:hypothetical protein LJC46_01180 [Desulfovibrio sp. OttesenSCG-928-G15]|nr:hypothetical protein [Desulfovibrio sp. OttesenSCG-928-G15]